MTAAQEAAALIAAINDAIDRAQALRVRLAAERAERGDWTGVPCEDPAEHRGHDYPTPYPDGPDRAELAALARDLKENT